MRINVLNLPLTKCQIKITGFLIIFFLLLSNFTDAQQWTQSRGPGGGDVYDMLERNGTLLAATPCGVFRTTDNGDTWVRSGPGLPDQNGFTEHLAATTNNIFVAAFSGSLYRSSDNGITWTNMPDASGYFILDIFASNDTVYLGLYGGGVARSVDEGVTFQLINTGFPASAYVVAFTQVGQYLFCGLSGNGGTVGIYRTNVSAINWTQMNNGLNYALAVGDLETKGSDLFALTAGGLFRSTDLGNTWFEPLPGFNDFGGHLTVYNGAVYTTPDGGSILKSTNDGASWTPVSNGLKPLTAFSYLPASTGLFVGSERGIVRTTNNATTWDIKIRGLTNTSVTSLFPDGNRLYATTRTTNLGRSEGVFFTDDAGQNWTPLNGGLLPNPEGKVIIKSGANLVLGTSNHGLFIKRPADIGFIRPPGILSTAIVDALISSGAIVLAGIAGNGELYRSTDYGETWTQSNTGFRADQEDQVACLYNHNGVIFAGAFNALYKSTDLGQTWTNSYTGIYPGAVITGITGIGNDLYAVDNGNLGIYKSTNNGASWFNVNNGIPTIIKFNTIFSYNGILYAGSDFGIYRSTDNGGSWTEYNDGLSYYKSTLSIAVLNNQLMLGTDQRAVWGRSIAGVLPINLQNFSAKETNGIVNLNWETATEINAKYFDVQRSSDGINFTSIGNVDAVNNVSGNAYKYLDVHPKPGVNFYRLTMVDLGGNSKKSGVVSVNLMKPVVKFTMTLTPNPATTQSVVTVSGNFKGMAVMSLNDAHGRKVAELYKGEITGPAFLKNVNVSNLPKGLYVIHLKINGESLTTSLIIQ